MPPSIEVRGGGGNLRTEGRGGAMMEGRGKVSLAPSSFYSAVAARTIEVGERPTEIDVDFSHSGRSAMAAAAAVGSHSLGSERASEIQSAPPSLSLLSLPLRL